MIDGDVSKRTRMPEIALKQGEHGLHLITGGAGFIGSNILTALSARGDRVAIADYFGHGDKWRNVAKHLICDFIDPADLDAWLIANVNKISSLIHMGAVSATTETDSDLIIATNFRLPQKLWNWCATNGVPFIYASSAAVYGNGDSGFDDHIDADSLARLRPLNPYGWSKLAFDRRVVAALKGGEATPPKWAGLRFFNVYGPNEYHKGSMRSLVAANSASVDAGAAMRLFKSYHPDYPDGGQMRDFVWVRDCVDVVLWMLDNPFPSDIYNVGSGKARTWLDLSNAMFRACGKSQRVEFIEMPAELRARYQYFTQANIEKLRSIGYDRPMTALEDGATNYIKGYLMKADPFL